VSELCALYQSGLWQSVCIAKVIGYSRSLGLLNAKGAFEGLEPCDGKLSRTVLRGKRGRKAPALPGLFHSFQAVQYVVFSFDISQVVYYKFRWEGTNENKF